MCGASGAFWEMSESVWNQRQSGRVLLLSEGPVGGLVDAFLGAPSSSSLAARPACVVAAALTAGHSAAAGRMELGREADGRNHRAFSLSSLSRDC